MHLTKEILQEIEANLDEMVIWEYLKTTAEIKIALLGTGLIGSNNLDEIFAEYMNFKLVEARDETDKKKLGV